MKHLIVFFIIVLSAFIFFGCQDNNLTEPVSEQSDPQKDPVIHSESGGFNVDGRHRNYTIFLPEDYSDGVKLPLVIYLHSYGWTAKTDRNYTRLFQDAATSNFIVVYPEGMPDWNSGISSNPDCPTTDIDDVKFINALIDTLSNHYHIDLQKIYACGYSNGGFMAYKLACQLGNRIAAIASVGGIMPFSTVKYFNPQRPMPVLHIHGTADWWVPIIGIEDKGWQSVDETLSHWIKFNNCVKIDTIKLPDLNTSDNCTVEKIIYTNYTNNCNVIYYKVLNGGHTWPGAGSPGFYNEGNVTGDFKANVEILNFFKKYALN